MAERPSQENKSVLNAFLVRTFDSLHFVPILFPQSVKAQFSMESNLSEQSEKAQFFESYNKF